MSKIDLGKLVKMADDAHEGFKRNLGEGWWEHPDAQREENAHRALKERHYAAVEGRASFNPLALALVRLQAKFFLLRYGKYRTP